MQWNRPGAMPGSGDERPDGARRQDVGAAMSRPQRIRALLERSGVDPDSSLARHIKTLEILGKHDLSDKLQNQLVRQVRRRILERRCFPVLRSCPPSVVKLGVSTDGEETGAEMGLSPEAFVRHVGVFGASGTGKTRLVLSIARQLIEAGEQIWIADVEDEYRPLLRMFPRDRVWWMRPEWLKLNPFQARGDPQAWIGKIVTLVRSCFFLRDGATALLSGILGELYLRRGCFAGSGKWPSLAHVWNVVQTMKFAQVSRSHAYLETLTRAIRVMLDRLGGTLNVIQSMQIREFTKRSVIWDVSDLDPQEREFFLCLLLMVANEEGE